MLELQLKKLLLKQVFLKKIVLSLTIFASIIEISKKSNFLE